MPTLALGSKARSRGFTLIELMVVVAIIAITAAVASLALPNPASSRLDREAARLVALLESARAEARAGGLAVRWVPLPDGVDKDYQFLGLPAALMPAARLMKWEHPEVRAEVDGARGLVLGPEPVIGAQRLVLHLDDQRLVIATDGLSPFAEVRGQGPDVDLPEADAQDDAAAAPAASAVPQ